jgi:flavodoxin
MKYEIAYISLSGNTEKLAYGLADKLPYGETIITDLSEEELSMQADIYLLCFGVNKGTVPIQIMEALDELSNKTIMLFVTCGMEPEEKYCDAIENKILPFLPDNCDYRGIFMCYGKFPDNVLTAANRKLADDPDNKYARKILSDNRLSANHPDEYDYENAYRFIMEHLE